MIWLGVALMVSLFLNACLVGGVIIMVIQLARLMHPRMYRKQAISNNLGVGTAQHPLKLNPKELFNKSDKETSELDEEVKKFVQTP